MIAYFNGRRTRPRLGLVFDRSAVHATTGVPLRDWVKTLPGVRWDPNRRWWLVTATGPQPDRELRAAGFVVVGPDGSECSLRDYTLPYAEPAPGDADGMWHVYPRLGGPEMVAPHVGPDTIWSAQVGAWLLHPSQLLRSGAPVPWCDHDPRLTSYATLPAPSHDHELVYDGSIDGLRGVPVADLASVPAVTAAAMSGVGISSVYDLLHHLPRRYIDLSKPSSAAKANPGEQAAVIGTVSKVLRPDRHGGMLKAGVRDSNGATVWCRWFNAGYMARKLVVGSKVVIFGKVETFTYSGGGSGFGMTNPLVEPVAEDSAGSIIGFYPASGKHELSTWSLYRAATEATTRLGRLDDPVPQEVLDRRGLVSRADAYRFVHTPTDLAQVERGRTRLAYDELLRLQLIIAADKAAHDAQPALQHPLTSTRPLVDSFLARLPFEPTGDQAGAIEAILADMDRPAPAHRLLMGDVGAGKSMVSVAALLAAVACGHQGAMIAPTEILAEQHAADVTAQVESLTKADGSPVTVELLTNKVTGKARKALLAALADGSLDIVVGTHALLADAVVFADLTSVVIDEQHRFGAEQRKTLRRKGSGGMTPHTLYASATPIPRTAAMTVFGDLEVSTLRQMPGGRTLSPCRHVEVADLTDRHALPWRAIRAAVDSGRQAMVVTPLVAKSLTAQDAAAHATAEDLAVGALAGLRFGVVTGKDKPADRAATMASFAAGDLDVLVATTVIEVGVNIPNATVMVVLGADKFGIAQLHQLRGRVGRGAHPGVCYLVAAPKSATGRDRMAAMTSTADGFALAELDLSIRGAGHITGSAQSGAGRDLAIADVIADVEIVAWAKEDAATLTANDPALARRPGLRHEVEAAVSPEAATMLRSA